MNGKSLAMMPWFPRDFIAATRHLALAERGAYRELLDYQWEMGTLPKDHVRLARLLAITLDEFEEIWPSISDKFEDSGNGVANKRLEEHRKKATEQRDKKINGAAKTNAKRHAERLECDTLSEPLCEPLCEPLTASPPTPSPTPSEEGEEREEKRRTPLPPQGGLVRKPRSVLQEPPEFAEIRKLYPRRSGSQRWDDAVKHYAKRRAEGHAHETIVAGIRRYADWAEVSQKLGTEGIQQAATFLGDNKGFLEPWAMPRAPPEQLSAVERALKANGVRKIDERVVAEQSGKSFDDLERIGPDVRQPSYQGFRRIGS